MQPLGFYTGVMPNDGSYLDQLQQRYGSRFEKMPRTLKTGILMQMAEFLLQQEINLVGSITATSQLQELGTIAQEITEQVSVLEQLGLMEAIVNQLKESQKEAQKQQE